MRYFNNLPAPSIEVLARSADATQSKIVLTKGEGSVTKAEHDALLKSEMINLYVRDGYLEFPECPVFAKIFNADRNARVARERELFDEKVEAAAENTRDLAELTKLVGDLSSELADSKAYLADARALNESMEARLAALEKPKTPAPAPASTAAVVAQAPTPVAVAATAPPAPPKA